LALENLIIIACSASVFADDQRTALDSGFDDFLPKPVMEEELFEILSRCLKLKWIYSEGNQSSAKSDLKRVGQKRDFNL
jgi:DNA-binding response OmpR family regulator